MLTIKKMFKALVAIIRLKVLMSEHNVAIWVDTNCCSGMHDVYIWYFSYLITFSAIIIRGEF